MQGVSVALEETLEAPMILQLMMRIKKDFLMRSSLDPPTILTYIAPGYSEHRNPVESKSLFNIKLAQLG
jgi:hypothetical protein